MARTHWSLSHCSHTALTNNVVITLCSQGMLSLALTGGLTVMWVSVGALVGYAFLLVRHRCLVFLIALAGVVTCTLQLHALLLTHNASSWVQIGTSFGVILGSFMAQIAGHVMCEDYQAPPSLMHGFVAAPILETVSLMLRLGLLSSDDQDVWKEVDEIRHRAAQLSLSFKPGSSVGSSSAVGEAKAQL